MSKETLIFIGGLLLIVLPFLGIPEDWERVAVVVFGVTFLLAGYALRRARYLAGIDQGNGERSTNSFVETTQTLFEDRTVQ